MQPKKLTFQGKENCACFKKHTADVDIWLASVHRKNESKRPVDDQRKRVLVAKTLSNRLTVDTITCLPLYTQSYPQILWIIKNGRMGKNTRQALLHKGSCQQNERLSRNNSDIIKKISTTPANTRKHRPARAAPYTLNRKCITSPSQTT